MLKEAQLCKQIFDIFRKLLFCLFVFSFQGFLANQKRAENLKDTSVLPDLCLSHANQLMIMLTNHRKLLDIKQKCTTAKQELANNLQVRLK